MRRFRIAMAVFGVLALVAVLTGCTMGAPATTEELLVRYAANENVDNFHVRANMDLSVSAFGVHATIPVTADLNAANNKAHGVITVGLSSLDTRDYEIEVYAELDHDVFVCHIGTSNGNATTWKCWTVNMTSDVDILTLTKLLASSELTKIAKDSDPEVCYELTVPTSTVLETVFDVTEGSAEVGGMDEQGMIDTVGDDKVRVGFTKDCLLRSFATGVLANLKSEQTNNVSVRVGLEISAVFDKYGEIDPASVALTGNVLNAAKPTDEPLDLIEIIGADSPLAGAVQQ